MRLRSSARINTAFEQSDDAVQADGDIAARDVKESRDLLVREPLVKTQLDDLAHVVRNRVEAAYTRSDLFERRRRLMDDWARYLAQGTGCQH